MLDPIGPLLASTYSYAFTTFHSFFPFSIFTFLHEPLPFSRIWNTIFRTLHYILVIRVICLIRLGSYPSGKGNGWVWLHIALARSFLSNQRANQKSRFRVSPYPFWLHSFRAHAFSRHITICTLTLYTLSLYKILTLHTITIPTITLHSH